jgi:hypothetical protein
MTPDSRRFFLCTWYQPVHDLGKRGLHSQVHKVRDGLAGAYISSLLTDFKYRFGGTLINVPSKIRSRPSLEESTFRGRCEDLVWIPTRLPFHEAPQELPVEIRPRRLRSIDRSETTFENRILTSFKPYLATCSRVRVKLSDAVCLPDSARAYRVCDFQEFSGGVLTQHGSVETRLRPPRNKRQTIGYLVALPPQDGLGRLIAAFGLGGTETLLFHHLLTTEYRERVKAIVESAEPRLFISKFVVPEYVPVPLLDYSRDDLAPAVLADCRL